MSKIDTPFARLQDQVIDALLRAFSPARRACARAERLISINADGEASEAEILELSRHVKRCPACRALENATLLVRADLRERPRAALPDSVAARLSAALENEQRRERVEALERGNRRRIALPRLQIAGGVAVLALVGTVGIALHQLSPTLTATRPLIAPPSVHQPHQVPIASTGSGSGSSLPPGVKPRPTSVDTVPTIVLPAPDTNTQQPQTVATSTVSRPGRALENSVAQGLPHHAVNGAQAEPSRIVAALPKPDNSLPALATGHFPSPAASITHSIHTHTTAGSDGHKAFGPATTEIATLPNHSDVGTGSGIKAGTPDAPSPAPVQTVASIKTDDQTAPLRQQTRLADVMRTIGERSGTNEMRSVQSTVITAAYHSDSGGSANGLGLVYANVQP